MTITAITLTNPGGESGTMTGWTQTSGSDPIQVTGSASFPIVPHTGSRSFRVVGFNPSDAEMYQQKATPVGADAAIDALTAAVRVSAWLLGNTEDRGRLTIAFYEADGTTFIDSEEVLWSSPFPSYVKQEMYVKVPADTRFLRIRAFFEGDLGASAVQWDDFSMDFSDDYGNDWFEQFSPKAHQVVMTALTAQNEDEGDAPVQVQAQQAAMIAVSSRPAEEMRALQVPLIAVAAQNDTEGDAPVQVQALQTVMIALTRGRPDTRRLRAWTFPQDDHNFYVLHLGRDKSIVFDMLSRTWAVWKSPDRAVWRASDGMAWEQENIGGDVATGLLWDINPSVRDDDTPSGLAEDRVPIRTVVRGMYALRLREALGCFRATLTVAQGSPAAAGVGIRLRTSVDEGANWIEHGTLTMDEAGRVYDISWVSLGLITEPGMLFEIIDTGYTSRINALDIDLGDEVEAAGG